MIDLIPEICGAIIVVYLIITVIGAWEARSLKEKIKKQDKK